MGHYSSSRAMRAMMMNEKGDNESAGKRTSGENLGDGKWGGLQLTRLACVDSDFHQGLRS